jgi:glucokinase
MKPKTFLFVGLIMLGVSLIIITVVILYPSTQIKDYPQYQKCLDDFTKIYSMDGKIDKVDNIAINAICDITHSSPSNSTIVLATFGGLFLIGGILQTIIGAIWFWSSNSEASYNTSNNSSGRNA